MSENNRAQALAGAVSIGGNGDTVVANAAAFLAFLEGSASPKAPKAQVATSATAAATTKATSTPSTTEPKSSAKPAKPAAKEAAPKAPDSKKIVGDKVNELLKANQRDAAVKLLDSFDGAQSASGIVSQGQEVIDAFMAGADEILASAEGGLAD
jgi:hypothetical protein